MNRKNTIVARRARDGPIVRVLTDGSTQPLVDRMDWDRLRAMTDAEVEAAANSDPAPPTVMALASAPNEDHCSFDPRWFEVAIGWDCWHFHRRLFARYGIVLGPGEFQGIVSAIRDGSARLVKQQSPRLAVYRVRIPSAKRHIYVLARANGFPLTAWPRNRKLEAHNGAPADTGTNYVLQWRLASHGRPTDPAGGTQSVLPNGSPASGRRHEGPVP